MIHLLVAQMISEVQLFAQQADLLEDGQYCQHLIVGAAYHLVGPCKLALLDGIVDTIDTSDTIDAVVEEPVHTTDNDAHDNNDDNESPGKNDLQ